MFSSPAKPGFRGDGLAMDTEVSDLELKAGCLSLCLPVSVSPGCSNEIPQTGWPKQSVSPGSGCRRVPRSRCWLLWCLCPHMMQTGGSGPSSRSYRGADPTLGPHPHDLITSQRPHFRIPSQRGLGLPHMNSGAGHEHSARNTHAIWHRFAGVGTREPSAHRDL